MHRIILDDGPATLNDKQIDCLAQFAAKNGQILAKHLPDSSVFKSKKGTWKAIWISEHGENAWPRNANKMMPACHVVDIRTRDVYLCPRTQRENASVEGREDEFIFLVDKTDLTSFRFSDVDEQNLDESPEVLLKRALSKISFL